MRERERERLLGIAAGIGAVPPALPGVCERERERENVCVYVCVRERE